METRSDGKNLIDTKGPWGKRPWFWKNRMDADVLGSTMHHLVDTHNNKCAIGLSLKRSDSYRIKNLLFRNVSCVIWDIKARSHMTEDGYETPDLHVLKHSSFLRLRWQIIEADLCFLDNTPDSVCFCSWLL